MVQKRMDKARKAPATTKAVEEYILTTKLYCGHCKNMMVGISGTSKTGKKHCYYACNGVKKKICKKKNVQKNYIEELVLTKCREALTDKNIEQIANKVMYLIKREKDTEKIRNLKHKLKKKQSEKSNLIKSIKDGASETIRNVIFSELENIENQIRLLEKELSIENMKSLPIDLSQIKFFLYSLRNGSLDDIKYRKTLINVLVNKIYLYDDKMTIIFNTQGTSVEISSDLISNAESSFLESNAPPFQTNRALKSEPSGSFLVF